MEDNVKRFREITTGMADLYARKNSDYGDSFGESVREFGPVSGIVRISDKFNRLKSLLLGSQERMVSDEAITDTLVDMACYCIMLKIELEND